MNVLIDKLPIALKVAGDTYKINSDYRTCLKIMLAWEDKELSVLEKQAVMLALLYGDNIPQNSVEACKMAIKFLNCGEVQNGESVTANCGRLYSFEKDAKFILTAINQTHGINLEKENPHWWMFVYMFMDLKEDCYFQKILYLRRQKQAGKLTKEERKIWSSSREILELDFCNPTDNDENMQEFLSVLNGGENK